MNLLQKQSFAQRFASLNSEKKKKFLQLITEQGINFSQLLDTIHTELCLQYIRDANALNYPRIRCTLTAMICKLRKLAIHDSQLGALSIDYVIIHIPSCNALRSCKTVSLSVIYSDIDGLSVINGTSNK